MKPASSSRDRDIRRLLEEMESVRAEYPADLFSARRETFLEEVARHTQAEVEEQLSSDDWKMIALIRRLKNIEQSYPPILLAARRGSLVRQTIWLKWVIRWAALRCILQERLHHLTWNFPLSTLKSMRSSLIPAGLALVMFFGFLLYGSDNLSYSKFLPSQPGTVGAGRILTADSREAKIICKPGYQPPLCLAGEFNPSGDLTYPGNGTARPAVAKDTMPGYGLIHQAAHVNDGLYGPGASWVSKSKNSWIKIDLGKATLINTVAFGRDRLGALNDRDPGQFVVAVALADDVYVHGNNSNDELEYSVVYDSKQAGFNGKISGAETVLAQFETRAARFIKLIFENEGTAIDEVEVFLLEPPMASSRPGNEPGDKQSDGNTSSISNPSATPLPSSTRTAVPTLTLVPTSTPTLIPTRTTVPTHTATAVPTFTPLPTDSRTPVPPPTDTPVPTNTPTDVPTDTPPPDTETPAATSTPVPANTETPGVTETPLVPDWLLGIYTGVPVEPQ